MLVFDAKIYKSGKQWLAEIPELDAMTQGKSRADAIRMLKDWVQSSLDDPKFDVVVHQRTSGEYVVVLEPTPAMIGLFLQRQRVMRGLTVRQTAHKLGFSSHNSYAQYESGKREASLSELQKFLTVLNPKKRLDLVFG